jgi:hypothetical protein
VLADPLSAPDHGLASSWRASHSPGGHPGATDAPVFTGDPAADLDGDGISALLEFALGGSDASAADRHRLPRLEWLTLDGESVPALAFARPYGIEGLRFILQTSADLAAWTDHHSANAAVFPPPQGASVPMRLAAPATSAGSRRQFLRLEVIRSVP